jgi:succinylarginine dihydrolase
MAITEINFDGIVGPSHNYAGLSLGNLASTRNTGQVSQPRAAAIQGIEKMRANVRLGLAQGVFLPHRRPDRLWLAALGTTYEQAEPRIAASAMSASAMWAANAATVSPAPDCADGKCHLTVANLKSMPHRSHEWPETLAQLRVAFANPAFEVHAPVPVAFGDEGAANHMRMAGDYDSPGLEIFVYGVSGGAFPARQSLEASKAIARLHKLDPDRTIFAKQSEEAIAAGAFHNDVVAVANRRVLFVHEQAFAEGDRVIGECAARFPELQPVVVPASEVPIGDAVSSYLFNAQLVSPPDGETTLIVPSEARETPSVWSWLQRHVAGNGPIRNIEVVDVRQSMANGGGPACLRLRVVADADTVDRRFLVDEAKLDRMAKVIESGWPVEIHSSELQDPNLVASVEAARGALFNALDLAELI